MYGAQTSISELSIAAEFENDVEMYGAQTVSNLYQPSNSFENDVEMYGAQTSIILLVDEK